MSCRLSKVCTLVHKMHTRNAGVMSPSLPSHDVSLIIHVPVALLSIAPLFVVMGALRKIGRGYPFMLSALFLMLFGTASIFATGSTDAVASHKAVVFSVLTLIFASIVFLPRALKQSPSAAISRVLPLVFVVFYAAGLLAIQLNVMLAEFVSQIAPG